MLYCFNFLFVACSVLCSATPFSCTFYVSLYRDEEATPESPLLTPITETDSAPLIATAATVGKYHSVSDIKYANYTFLFFNSHFSLTIYLFLLCLLVFLLKHCHEESLLVIPIVNIAMYEEIKNNLRKYSALN